MAVGGIFNLFGGWWPDPSFRNSPFRRYLSNGPCPVPQFALQPQFRPIFRIFNFGKFRYYYSNNRRYDPPSVFRISVFWGFPGSGTSPGGFFGKFQYRTTRFCGVSCPHVPKTWYGRFFAERLANSKVQFLPFQKLGRTDRKFGISRSKSPYPQIVVPLSPSYPLFPSHQSFTFFNVF